MKHLIFAFLFCLLAGCATTSPYTLDNCNFSELSGKEYIIKPSEAAYVANDFYYNPFSIYEWQNHPAAFNSLISQPIKVFKTDVVTGTSAQHQKYISSRYGEDVINGVPYMRDRVATTELITQDCSLYYFSSSGAIKGQLVSKDGSKLTGDDWLQLYGPKTLQPRPLTAKLNYDKFSKQLTVATPSHQKLFLRGSINTANDQVSYLQLYVDATFIGDWGHLRHALDLDGQQHELVKINTDANCSGVTCYLTETVGVTVDRGFLERHQQGFELKLYGTREKVIQVHGQMVKSFLEGLDSALEKSKAKDFEV